MIEAELVDRIMPAAILTKMSVAGEDVAAIQVQALLRQAIVREQANHPGDLDLEVHGANPILVRQPDAPPLGAPLPPRLKGVNGELTFFVVNDFRQLAAEQGKRAADADHMDRHVKTIEREDAGL